MKHIRKGILTILIVLIFFTSLGSVAADSDDISLDESVDSIVFAEDISTNIESSNEGSQSMDILDENIGSDEIIILDDSNGPVDEESTVANQDKKGRSSKKLSSADDSRTVSVNNVISTNSQSSSNILSSPKIIVINDSKSYEGSINEYIQKLIDEAVAGSTIQFAGSSYENIYLKISKPLNIISKSGTTIRNIFNMPVFTILEGGSGTNISGFTVNLVGSFVDAKDVSNILISGNKISTKRNAITFEGVYDSSIRGNVFSNFKIAMDISKSGGINISKNNITPKEGNNIGIYLKDISSKKGINILNNYIVASDRRKEGTGIYFDKNASNVLIKGNTLKKWYTAIDFPYSVNNVSIINNTISDNGDGVIINGWIDNFTFNKNLVTGNGRVGVLFDFDFMGTKGGFTLENNYFTANGALDLQNKGDKAVSIGRNFAKNRCYRVGMKYGLNIRTRQVGSRYYFSVVDEKGRAVSGMPNFSAVLDIGGHSYTVNFIDSVAYVDTGSSGIGNGGSGSLDIGEDNRKLSDWGQFNQVDSRDMDYYEQFYNDLMKSIMEAVESNDISDDDNSKDYNSSNNNYDNHSSSYSNRGSGSGDSGVSTGSNSINSDGTLSDSSSSTGASPSSASSAVASPSQSAVPESASAKTLSIDDETFRVIGVGGLVLLIILVIGLYYREDIKDMMEE